MNLDSMGRVGAVSEQAAGPAMPRRRPATVAEAKAVAHPLRQRILRLCLERELTNKQLADRLGSEPGTVYYHVKQLVDAGLLIPAPVRTGDSGALEKPYRTSGQTWWLSLGYQQDPDTRMVPVQVFNDELREAGPESIQTTARFVLHLSEADMRELDRRIVAVIDEFVATDGERRQLPAHGGIFLLHKLAEDGTGSGPGASA
jgi:DNA-binding transcriptional ArsR family regulator